MINIKLCKRNTCKILFELSFASPLASKFLLLDSEHFWEREVAVSSQVRIFLIHIPSADVTLNKHDYSEFNTVQL